MRTERRITRSLTPGGRGLVGAVVGRHFSAPACGSATAALVPATAALVPATAALVPATAALVPATAALVPATAALVPATAALVPATAALVPATAGVRSVRVSTGRSASPDPRQDCRPDREDLRFTPGHVASAVGARCGDREAAIGVRRDGGLARVALTIGHERRLLARSITGSRPGDGIETPLGGRPDLALPAAGSPGPVSDDALLYDGLDRPPSCWSSRRTH